MREFMTDLPFDLKGRQKPPSNAHGVASLSRNHRGFTLIELLIVIAVIAVLASLAVPSFTDYIRNTRQRTAATQLVGDLNLARSESIKRNVHVLVCARNAAGTDCSAITDWRAGWVVCIEGAVINQCAASTAAIPNPIVVRSALNEALTLTYANPITAAARTVRFNSNSSQGSDGAANTLTIGGSWTGAVNRVISISSAGMISKR